MYKHRERLDKSFWRQVAFSRPLCGYLVLSVSCPLHRSCQMALQLLGRWKVTDAVWQGRAGAMSLFKGHDLSFRAGRRADTCRVERLQIPRGGRGHSLSFYPISVGRLGEDVAVIKVEPPTVYSEISSHTSPLCLTYTFTWQCVLHTVCQIKTQFE